MLESTFRTLLLLFSSHRPLLKRLPALSDGPRRVLNSCHRLIYFRLYRDQDCCFCLVIHAPACRHCISSVSDNRGSSLYNDGACKFLRTELHCFIKRYHGH